MRYSLRACEYGKFSLRCLWWEDWKCKYLLVSVGFSYNVVQIRLFLSMYATVSKNEICVLEILKSNLIDSFLGIYIRYKINKCCFWQSAIEEDTTMYIQINK